MKLKKLKKAEEAPVTLLTPQQKELVKEYVVLSKALFDKNINALSTAETREDLYRFLMANFTHEDSEAVKLQEMGIRVWSEILDQGIFSDPFDEPFDDTNNH